MGDIACDLLFNKLGHNQTGQAFWIGETLSNVWELEKQSRISPQQRRLFDMGDAEI